MNKETQSFVTELLLKYNTHKVVDENSLLFHNIGTYKLKDGSVVELECVDAFALIADLCEALDITQEGLAFGTTYEDYCNMVSVEEGDK